MTESKPQPTRLLRLAAKAAPWGLGLVAAAWLVLAIAWGALHGWIVPRIGEFRPQLEAQASLALGVPVRIGSISAHSTGWIPSVELHDVAVLDPQGREALRLPRVLAALSPASLLKLGFEQLVIDQPELDVRRSADGRLLVAGLDVSQGDSQDTRALDWLFAQTELVVRGGTVRWTDEQRGAPPLALSAVDFVMRNKGLRHSLRLDATPPAEWGERFSAMAQFRQPLLSVHRGRWKEWDGPVYASLPRVDVSQLRQYTDLGSDMGLDVAQGVGALRLWAELQHGKLQAATADVALANVRVQLGADLQPLALQQLQGRLTGRPLAGGVEFSTEGLQFTTDAGVQWSGGNVFARLQEKQGQLRADRLDLATLAQIAERLPLGPDVHTALDTYAPKGLVERIEASWQGDVAAPTQFQAKGRATNLDVGGAAALGVRGATLDFDLNQAAGKASLQIAQGALELPGVFEEPVLPVDQLSAGLAWKIDGQALAVQVSDMRFANPDLEGTLQASWHTSDPARSGSRSRFPGVLDLQGQLSRAEGARVHRYLPLSLPETRHYLRDALLAGSSDRVKFRVKGDLHDFPFLKPQLGEFRVVADVKNATYAYSPPSLHPAGSLPWPALEQLSGELVLDRGSLQVNRATAVLAGAPNLRIHQAEVQIADVEHAVVVFKGQGRGPLPDMLGAMARSPLAALTEHALDRASGTGTADIRLQLQLPIDKIEQSKIQGSLVLGGNDLQVVPGTVGLEKVRGVVNFTESGFTVAGGQARLLGGEARIDGGTRAPVAGNNPTAAVASRDASLQFRVQGVATADGLRQAPGLGSLSRLTARMAGSAAYSAVLGLRQQVLEVAVNSTLQGMALDLPAPYKKSAEASMPLRFENTLLPSPAGTLRDRLALDLPGIGSVAYVRDVSGPEPRVLRGSMAVGLPAGETVAMPEEGVAANVRVDSINTDAWDRLLASTPGATGMAAVDPNAIAYLPNTLKLRVNTLTSSGRTLHHLVMDGTRQGTTWHANMDADELNGYVEFRQPGGGNPGRVYARLTRLTLTPSASTEVNTLFDEPTESVPALDIVVDDLELKGKKLGRVEVDAVNRGMRDWRLNKLTITTPEAQLSATGNWTALASAALPSAQGLASGYMPHRSVMNFKLDINDAGALLTRLGMAGVIRRGKGQMEGQVAWVGSPLSLDYPSLGGQFNLEVENGQFLKADPGLAKLLGVLNLQALPRRLTLDFRDVFSEGFAFDFIRGDVRIDQGTANTNNLQMKGVNAAVLMDGSASIPNETQNLKVVVVPEINAGTASLVATVINPAIGIGSFLAQWFLRRPLTEAATQEFHIDGTWADPKITKVPHKIAESKADLPPKPGTTP
ncbi:MAG: YhdP family protein [Burkholderiales bacterium]|nr:YhdP family protein [Burkholderiales bacterium]